MRRKKERRSVADGGECEQCGWQTRDLHPTTLERGLVCFCCWERLASADPFAPPPTPVQVWCIHCENEYCSDAMVQDDEGLWCCGTAGCGGVGFGFDVHRGTSWYPSASTGS